MLEAQKAAPKRFSDLINIKLNYKNSNQNLKKGLFSFLVIIIFLNLKRFLKMIGSLQDLGVVEEDKIKILLNQYLSKNQSKLGIDFVSTLNLTDVED